MKRIFTMVIAMCATATMLMSQVRYIDEVFTDVDVTTDVEYDSNYSVLTGTPDVIKLYCDVYEPNGDTETERPIVILSHAGSFLPKCVANTLPLGDRKDSAIVEMCNQFAKRGYVAVAMDYRLGWNPLSTDADVRAGTIMQAVYRALQDMKACVRYFKVNQSTYGVDTNRVIVGGSNSGGYLALAYSALNDTAETQLLKFRNSQTLDPFIDMDIMGDWNGRGGSLNYYGNAGPSSDAHMALNLGGAMADTSWQEAGEIPIVSFHGVDDALTPYGTDVVIVAATGQPVIEVSGSHDLSRYATALGNQDLSDQFFSDAISQEAAARTPHSGLYPFPGAVNGYEPWAWYNENSPCIDTTCTGFGSAANPCANKPKALAYIDTIMGYFCPRAVQVLLLPGNTVGVQDQEKLEEFVNAYPNPAQDVINIASSLDVNSVSVFNVSGKQVFFDQNERNRKFAIDVTNYEKGLYFVRIETSHGVVSKKIVVN